MAKSKITKRVILRLFYKYSRPVTLKDIYKKNYLPQERKRTG